MSIFSLPTAEIRPRSGRAVSNCSSSRGGVLSYSRAERSLQRRSRYCGGLYSGKHHRRSALQGGRTIAREDAWVENDGMTVLLGE
jgi:hypothetical protein